MDYKCSMHNKLSRAQWTYKGDFIIKSVGQNFFSVVNQVGYHSRAFHAHKFAEKWTVKSIHFTLTHQNLFLTSLHISFIHYSEIFILKVKFTQYILFLNFGQYFNNFCSDTPLQTKYSATNVWIEGLIRFRGLF